MVQIVDSVAQGLNLMPLQGRWTAYRRFKFESLIQILPESITLNRWFKFEPVWRENPLGGEITSGLLYLGLKQQIYQDVITDSFKYYYIANYHYITGVQLIEVITIYNTVILVRSVITFLTEIFSLSRSWFKPFKI